MTILWGKGRLVLRLIGSKMAMLMDTVKQPVRGHVALDRHGWYGIRNHSAERSLLLTVLLVRAKQLWWVVLAVGMDQPVHEVSDTILCETWKTKNWKCNVHRRKFIDFEDSRRGMCPSTPHRKYDDKHPRFRVAYFPLLLWPWRRIFTSGGLLPLSSVQSLYGQWYHWFA